MVQQAAIPRRTLVIFGVLAVVFMAQMIWWIIFNVGNFRETVEQLKETHQNERVIVASILNNHIASLHGDFKEMSEWGFLETNSWDRLISGYEPESKSVPPDSLTMVLKNEESSILIFLNRDYLRELARVDGQTELSGNLSGVIVNPRDAIKAEQVKIDDSWLRDIETESDRHIRMLIMEGSFFILLILIGLWMVYSAIRKKQAAANEQTLFVHSITHELKIPITSVNLFLDTIKRREYDGELTKKLMPKMKEDLRRLNGLIDNIINIRKLSEKRPGELPKINLSNEVSVFAGAIKDKVESSGGKLKVSVEEGIFIRGSSEELHRVWETLVDNSLKYAASEELLIVVNLKRSAAKAVMEIIDNGPGIAPERKDRIFDKFSRGEDEKSRSIPGSGLGLYIAKEYILRNGGTVGVDDPEEGSGLRLTMKFDVVS